MAADIASRRVEGDPATPCAVAIDILDEDHSLRLAMRRLGTDPALRAALGAARARLVARKHSIEAMVDDYRTLIADAARAPARRRVPLPAHLLNEGDGTLDRLIEPFGLPAPLVRRAQRAHQ